jgi:hypothetical protein
MDRQFQSWLTHVLLLKMIVYQVAHPDVFVFVSLILPPYFSVSLHPLFILPFAKDFLASYYDPFSFRVSCKLSCYSPHFCFDMF